MRSMVVSMSVNMSVSATGSATGRRRCSRLAAIGLRQRRCGLFQPLQRQVRRATEIGLAQHALLLAIGVPEAAPRTFLVPRREAAACAFEREGARGIEPGEPFGRSYWHGE